MNNICYCDYCNAQVKKGKEVDNYIPELNAIYCDKCLADYDKRSLQNSSITEERV